MFGTLILIFKVGILIVLNRFEMLKTKWQFSVGQLVSQLVDNYGKLSIVVHKVHVYSYLINKLMIMYLLGLSATANAV